MKKNERISSINSVLRDYFAKTSSKRNDPCKRVYASFYKEWHFQ